MGLVLTVIVTSASVLDRNGACLLLERRTGLGRNYVSPDLMAPRAALSKIGSHRDCVFACYMFCALKVRRDSLSGLVAGFLMQSLANAHSLQHFGHCVIIIMYG